MAAPPYPVRGRSVLITGAARGIGAESARQLAARGARVSLVGLEPEELERTAAECGPDAAWFEADVTDPDSLARAVAGTGDRFGSLDAVIANAGTSPIGPVRLADPSAIERCLEVNLLGVSRTVHACLPELERSCGYLLVIASLTSAVPVPGMAAYAATKAAVEAFASALRMEERHHGVDVGIGYFSWIDTELVAGADHSAAGAVLRSNMRGPLAKTYPVSRAGEGIVRAVERRAPSVAVPRWTRLLLAGRELMKPLVEREARRVAPEIERALAREIEERGQTAATGLVGAGGAAAAASGSRGGWTRSPV